MASLSLTPVTSAANANLTALGYDDYASWAGATSGTPINRKSGGGSIIPIPALVGGATWGTYTGDPRTLSATDSTPTASWSSNDGIFNDTFGTGTGYQWSSAGGNGFPADTTSRTLRIYFGAYDVVAVRVELSLSDASASPITDTTLAGFDNTSSDYYIDVTYAAASGGQTLNVKITVQQQRGSGFSNITLNAALIDAAGGTAYALPYDAASYSLTASAETLQATRALAVAATSYAVTAAAETLSVGRKLDVAAASYALTTSAETLTVTRALGIDPASYSLSAADVTLTYESLNKALSIDPAAYALTAADVGMAYSGAVVSGDAWGKKKRKAQVQAEVNARNLEILKADVAEEMKAEAIVETVEYDDDEDALMLLL